MKRTKTKNCKSCNFCKRVYRKFGYFFSKFDLYYCSVHNLIVEVENSCEIWQQKKILYDLSAKRFDEAEEDIKILKDYFKEI